VTSFWTPTVIIQTFKFAPVTTSAAVRGQLADGPSGQGDQGLSEADHMTGCVGNACQIEPNKVDFTAIAYGVDERRLSSGGVHRGLTGRWICTRTTT
jgi:hypothetical protein